ncbi:hypothetical protein M426DRAFT_7913 [Hypoxylon sp. CI-4A]|nr:hypothetical protein M426DRAFT_7913 [Hypoxylon sp. CI-4A]
MENPEREVRHVIPTLTEYTRQDQRDTLEKYFLPEAYFIHPFCRVPSFEFQVPYLNLTLTSRQLIFYIYQWYRILSPQIDLEINSTSFDPKNNILYVTLHQTFTLWFVPFQLWKAHVKLVTVLQLEHLPVDKRQKPLRGAYDDPTIITDKAEAMLYFVKGQEDHYQVEDFLKFIAPWGASLLWISWQLFATFVCAVGVIFLRIPILFLREKVLGLDGSAIKKQ